MLTQMDCVEENMLEIDTLQICVILARMNHFETRLMVLSQNETPTTQDGKLFKEFCWENKQNGDWNNTNFGFVFFWMSFDTMAIFTA